MLKIRSFDLPANTQKKEKIKMNKVDMINNILVGDLTRLEKEMVMLVERKKLIELAIETELSKDSVDMILVMDHETSLSIVESNIIKLLDLIEEEELEKEYLTQKEMELEAFESSLIEKVNAPVKEDKESKISSFIKEKFNEKLNPKVKERRKKRLKVYDKPKNERVFKDFPMLNAVEDVVEIKVKELSAEIKAAQSLVLEKYKDLAFIKGNKVYTEITYNNGLKAKMNYWYLDGFLIYSEPIFSSMVGSPNLNIPTYGPHKETYRTYIPYRYTSQQLEHYSKLSKSGFSISSTRNPALDVLGENFGCMCFINTGTKSINSTELEARNYQKEIQERGNYLKIAISMTPREDKKNEQSIQYGYGAFLDGELIFFDRHSRYGNAYSREFKPNYIEYKTIS